MVNRSDGGRGLCRLPRWPLDRLWAGDEGVSDMTLAWHFADTQMRDGTPLGAPGEIEIHHGPLVMYVSGLHASERLLDALRYAPGSLLRRVRLGGEILRDNDKMVASRREVLWECDMTPALRLFARRCALDVAHLWDMPPVVREYLMTGREDIMDAAWDAARAAARAAAWAATRAAAWDAAADAAWDAAGDAAWAAQELRLVAYAQAARAGLFRG